MSSLFLCDIIGSPLALLALLCGLNVARLHGCALIALFVETSEGSRSVLLSAFLCYAPSGLATPGLFLVHGPPFEPPCPLMCLM